MAPQQNVDFVIVKLSYVKKFHRQPPRITQKQQRSPPSAFLPHVRCWMDRTMCTAESTIPRNLEVRYTEWNIVTDNEDIFKIFDYCYDNVLLVLGEEYMYWLYHANIPLQRRLEGWSELIDKYCSCCIDKQYLKIMQMIKECVMESYDE